MPNNEYNLKNVYKKIDTILFCFNIYKLNETKTKNASEMNLTREGY